MRFKLVESELNEELYYRVDFTYNGNTDYRYLITSNKVTSEDILNGNFEDRHETVKNPFPANFNNLLNVSVTQVDYATAKNDQSKLYNSTNRALRHKTSIGTYSPILQTYQSQYNMFGVNGADRFINHHTDGNEITYDDKECVYKIPYNKASKISKGVANCIHQLLEVGKLVIAENNVSNTFNYPIYCYDKSTSDYIVRNVEIQIK